jgi:hypothetical protein
MAEQSILRAVKNIDRYIADCTGIIFSRSHVVGDRWNLIGGHELEDPYMRKPQRSWPLLLQVPVRIVD